MVLDSNPTTKSEEPGPEPEPTGKSEPMSLNSLLLSSVRATFLGQFLLVPKQSTKNNRQYQHQRQLDSVAVREVEQTVRIESTRSHEIRDEYQSKKDDLSPDSTPPSVGANAADEDFPVSDWNMREDCSIPDDFPARSSLQGNKNKKNHKHKCSLKSNSDHSVRHHSRKSAHSHGHERMSQSEQFRSTRRGITATTNAPGSNPLSNTSYEQRWTQSRCPPIPSKSTRGSRSSVPVDATLRSKSSRSLVRSSVLISTREDSVDEKHKVEHSYRSKRRSSRRQTTNGKPGSYQERSMSKSDPGRSSNRRRSSSTHHKRTSHSKRSSRRRTSMDSSVPHHHHEAAQQNKSTRRRSSMGSSVPQHHHETSQNKSTRRRSSMGSGAPQYHHETADKSTRRRNRMEEKVSGHESDEKSQRDNDGQEHIKPADDWKPRIPLRSTGVAVEILKQDSRRLPLSDELKIINDNSGEDKEMHHQTKVGGQLSQSQSSHVTKTTAASTLKSGDTSIGLPELKPMTTDLVQIESMRKSSGFSNAKSPIANSIEW